MLFILLVVLSGYAFGLEGTSVELDFEIDYNPCLFKQCSSDEECRVVAHAELLEIPVAACVKKRVQPTQRDPCISLRIGSNILNCKTALEWETIGLTQCSGGGLQLDQESLKMKYICHQKAGDQYKYLSADFKCCSKVTPSVLTGAPPGTTTPSDRPKEDGWDAVVGGLVVSETLAYTKALTFPPGTGSTTETNIPTIQGRTEEGETTEHPTMDAGPFEALPEDKTDKGSVNDSGSVIPFLVGFAIICSFLVFISLAVYVRFLVRRRRETQSKKNPTVLINPNCQNYKVVFETPSITDKQPYSSCKDIYY